MNEAEARAKEAERLRSQNLFEGEKERARWQLERDTMSCKVKELEEQVDKLVMQKESLMKENTRLKVEQKSAKQRSVGGTSFGAGNTSVNASQVFPATTVSGGGVQQFHQSHLLMPQSTTSSSTMGGRAASGSHYGNMLTSKSGT